MSFIPQLLFPLDFQSVLAECCTCSTCLFCGCLRGGGRLGRIWRGLLVLEAMGKGRLWRDSLRDPRAAWTGERGSCPWCSVLVQGVTLRIGAGITEKWGRSEGGLFGLLVGKGLSTWVGGWDTAGDGKGRRRWYRDPYEAWLMVGELQLVFYWSARGYLENWSGVTKLGRSVGSYTGRWIIF